MIFSTLRLGFKSSLRPIQVLRISGFSTGHKKLTVKEKNPSKPPNEYKIIYRNPFVIHFAVFTKLKIYVTALTSGLIPLYFVASDGSDTGALALISLLTVSSTGLLAAGEFSRRVVGIIYLHEDKDKIKIARLNFFGNRVENIFDVDKVKFVSETSENIDDAVWKVHFDDPKQKHLFISTRSGGVMDMEGFKHVFGSESVTNYAPTRKETNEPK